MTETITKTLITEDALKLRIDELAAEINRDYEGKQITLVGTLKGAMIFMADLARKLTGEVIFEFVGTSSYGDGATSSGTVQFTKGLDFETEGKHIILLEDILDTGHTLDFLRKHFEEKKPASFKICCLLDKPERRLVKGLNADYLGFTIPDNFVVGYGLDYAQRYRNLPYIGVLQLSED